MGFFVVVVDVVDVVVVMVVVVVVVLVVVCKAGVGVGVGVVDMLLGRLFEVEVEVGVEGIQHTCRVRLVGEVGEEHVDWVACEGDRDMMVVLAAKRTKSKQGSRPRGIPQSRLPRRLPALPPQLQLPDEHARTP